MTKKIPYFHIYSMLLLLFAPILWIYGNPDGWSYEELLIIPTSTLFFLYYLITKKGFWGVNNPLPQGFGLYFIYWAVLMTVVSMSIPLLAIQCYLVFFLFFATFSRDKFIKMYKIVALICIVFFGVQEFLFLTTGNRPSGIISTLPLHYKITMSEFLDFRLGYTRSSSFFSEPAHMAQFLLPLLAIELFHDKSKFHFFYAFTIGVSLLFIQSGNGLFGLVTILLFAIYYFFHEKIKYKWMIVVIFPLIIVGAGYLYFNSEMGFNIMDRQAELNRDYEGGSRSGFMRIWRGYYVYEDYSLTEKIFGNPDVDTQLSHVKASGMTMSQNAELYFNTIQKILLNTGIIGLIIFVFIMIRVWRNNTICGRALIATFIVLSFMSAIYMSHTMILFLVLAESMKVKKFEYNCI